MEGYSECVGVFRRFSVSVLTVSFLLGFTALDLGLDVLAYDSCQADAHGSSASPENQEAPAPSDVHHDDCFCCSHCIRHSVAFSLSHTDTIEQLSPIRRSHPLLVAPQAMFRPPKLT